MRTVVSSSEIGHLWAHQTQYHAKAGNIFFNGPTIFSYGHHFPMARIVESGKGKHKGEKAVLFTTRTYSVSTAKHLSYTHRAIPAGMAVFNVPLEDRATQDTELFKTYADRLEAALLDAARPRVKQAPRLAQAQSIAEEGNRFAEFFGLRKRLNLPADFSQAVEAARIKQGRENAKRAKAREAAELVALEQAKERARKFQEEQLPEWLNGARTSLPFHDFAYLRRGGEEVETSHGARFPIEHAKRAYRLLAKLVAKREEYRANGHTIRVGHYGIDSLSADGMVRAGCHKLLWAEIERFAKLMKW